MVTVTLAGSPEEVHDEAKRFFQPTFVVQPTVVVEKESKPKAVKAEVAKEAAAGFPAAQAQIAEQKPASPPTGDLTEAVKIVVTRVAKLKGRQTAMDLLAKYGAKTGKEVPAARHAEFLAEANAMIPADQQVSA